MSKKLIASFILTLALLAATGCGQKNQTLPHAQPTQEKNDDTKTTNIYTTKKGSENLTANLKNILTAIFGNATQSSYMPDFPAKGTVAIDYKTPRVATLADVEALASTLKNYDYKILEKGSGKDYGSDGSENNAVVVASDGQDGLFIFFEIGKNEISVWAMPDAELKKLISEAQDEE